MCASRARSAIESQRASRNAPVDYLGCHTLGEPADGPANFRFQTLLALVLSPRTADAKVAQAMHTLRFLVSAVDEPTAAASGGGTSGGGGEGSGGGGEGAGGGGAGTGGGGEGKGGGGH